MLKAGGVEHIMGGGMRCLASGRLFKALGLFKAAVDRISPSDRDRLHRALYWLGVSALRLGRRDVAVKALSSAKRLRRRGHANALYGRVGNDYGMPRQCCPAEDDRLAFFSLQVASYLRARPERSFADSSERDMVLSLISSAWSDLGRRRALEGLSAARKAELFRGLRIAFPRIQREACRVIGVDFRGKARLGAESRCPCGSGRPWALCCGRIAEASPRSAESLP